MKTQIEFTRINNDTNGNPRYVCPFQHFITGTDRDNVNSLSNPMKGIFSIDLLYQLAVKRANKIGGRKFHNKQYGGGIVFQSYNIERLESDILELVNKGEVCPIMGDFDENGDAI